MGKTLVIDEEQLREIIDGPYLEDSDDNDFIYHNIVATGGGVSPSDFGKKPEIADDAAEEMGKNTGFWPNTRGDATRSGLGVMTGYVCETYNKKEFEAKILSELNSRLAHKTMTVPVRDNDGNIVNTVQGSENMLSKRMHDDKKRNPREYKAIRDELDRQRGLIKATKKANTAAGMANQFQKAGGTKTGFGTAHTPKAENIFGAQE